MKPLTKVLIALVIALSVYAASFSTPLILLSIAALALYIALPFAALYVIVKFVKFAWKH